MRKFIWSLGYALQRLGCAVQKATGWKPERKKAATGKPRGRPRKKKESGTPLPLEVTPAQSQA